MSVEGGVQHVFVHGSEISRALALESHVPVVVSSEYVLLRFCTSSRIKHYSSMLAHLVSFHRGSSTDDFHLTRAYSIWYHAAGMPFPQYEFAHVF